MGESIEIAFDLWFIMGTPLTQEELDAIESWPEVSRVKVKEPHHLLVGVRDDNMKSDVEKRLLNAFQQVRSRDLPGGPFYEGTV